MVGLYLKEKGWLSMLFRSATTKNMDQKKS